MKSIHKIIILLFLIKVTIVNAQFKEKNALYTSGEINIGNYVGIDINLNYVYKNNYSFKIGYTGNIRKPKSQPEDYSSGLTGVVLLELLIHMTN